MQVLDTQNKAEVSGCFEVQADFSSNTSAAVKLRVQSEGALVSADPAQALSQIEISLSPTQTPVVRVLVNNTWTQV